MQTIKLSSLPAVSKTLLIPLAARAKETGAPSPAIRDDRSVEILAQINTEGTIIDGGNMSTHGILARTKTIDESVGKLLQQHPDSIVINLGAGLDTRFDRLDNGKLHWYDLDLPEVIQLRQRFFAPNDRVHSIAKSVMDFSWVSDIPVALGQSVIIILEGLLMYFPRQDVAQILNQISAQFAGAHIFFDVVHSFFEGKGISNTFLWGLDNAKDIEQLAKKLRLVESWSTGNLLKKRQSFAFRFFNFLPLTRKRSQILHVQCATT